MINKYNFISAVICLSVFFSAQVQAGCGADFCSLNTQWDIQGAWVEPGTRIDLRYEYIDQDQLRNGTDKIGIGEIPQHHDEVRTINRNALLTLDHAFDPSWGLSVSLPVHDREHRHIHNHHGEQITGQWDYSSIGDLKVLGRYQPDAGPGGVLFGLKFATGKTDLANGADEAAERTLQPGSGTTDILLGGFYRHRTPGSPVAWFTQLLWQTAVSEQDAFKPGNRINLDTGIRYDSQPNLGWMLQLNVLHKGSDSGNLAEPENSGGSFAYLSPGIGIGIAKSAQLYIFLQQALHQDVEGVQLTADQSVVTGFSARF